MVDIKGFTIDELKAAVTSRGWPAFRAAQVCSWIYKKLCADFSLMSDLPLEFRDYLQSGFSLVSLGLADKLYSEDGTVKFLFRLQDDNLIESVLIPADKRITGCISTQAGCGLRCAFCASGMLGLKRNLHCAEIVEQVWRLQKEAGGKLTHLVFMGTGEPFENYDNLIKAIRIINSTYGFNIGARRITISTSGIIPGIKRLEAEGLQVELSVSLHAAEDSLRSRLMPVNKRYPLSSLIQACRRYQYNTGRQVTFEYILVEGVNSGLPNAIKLGRMLQGMDCKVNLIPLNPVAGKDWLPPSACEVRSFQSALQKTGIRSTLRRARGRDIEAACGQLRLKYEIHKAAKR